MKTATDKRVLLHENKAGIEDYKTHVQICGESLSRVYEEYTKLNLGELGADELYKLLADPTGFVKSKIAEQIGEVPSFGNFKMKTSALIDSIELPDTSPLEQAVSFLNQFAKKHHVINELFGFFHVDEGKVTVNETRLNQGIEQFRVYASTPEEIEAANAYKSFMEYYKKLDSIMKSRGHFDGMTRQTQNNLFLRNIADNSLEFNPHFYQILIGN
jgi:hypothetical protein